MNPARARSRNPAGLAAALLAVFGLAGCSNLPFDPAALQQRLTSRAPARPAPARPMKVDSGGDGFALGDVEKSAVSPQQYVDRLDELRKADRPASAARWARLYPDVNLGVLREPVSVQTTAETMRLAAEVQDEISGGSEAAWTALLDARRQNAARYAEYDALRRQFMDHLQNGRVDQALGLKLPGAAEGTCELVRIDALRLQAVGQVLANRPQDAAAPFEQALRLCQGRHPYEAANLLLLLSDAQRRAGDLAGAESTWKRASQQVSGLAFGPAHLCDPVLWERTAYLRPANCPWPDAVQRVLAREAAGQGVAPEPPSGPRASAAAAGRDEMNLWTCIGQWRFQREEFQAALVAFKRAESLTADQYVANRLRVLQARTLARLEQPGPATAILLNLAGQSDPQVSRPAIALLGTIKIQQGAVQQGFNLLRKAVEEDPDAMWPERAEAEADLGLAYLVVGDEAAGLRWLHAAQKGFEAAAQTEELVQSLENEAAYLEQSKKRSLAGPLRDRVAALERG